MYCKTNTTAANTTAPIRTSSGLNLISDFLVSEKDIIPKEELGPLD